MSNKTENEKMVATQVVGERSILEQILAVLQARGTPENGISILVVGLGGGSDCQQAYVLSRKITSELTAAGVVNRVAFATTKWSLANQSNSEEKFPYNNVYSIEHNEFPASYLNEMVNGKPRWVGTSLFEQTIPPAFHNWLPGGQEFTSPLIIEIPKPNSGTTADQAHATEEAIHNIQTVAPCLGENPPCWDVVIGVDTGGDVLGGIEDSRDVMMLQTLQRMISRQRMMGFTHSKLIVSIVGLCVDGETFFDSMMNKLSVLQAGGAVLGSFSLAPYADVMAEVCKAMAKSKTPQIILSCLSGELEKVDYFNRPTIEEKKEGLCVQNVESIPVTQVKGLSDPIGRTIGDFVQLPQRHHVDMNGVAIPSPIVPERWVTDGILLDGELVMELLDFPHLVTLNDVQESK